MPDHSLLKWNFEFDSGGGKSANASSEHSYTNGDFYRFDVSNVSKNFLDDDALLFRVNDTISKLESSARLQSDIDGVYSDWCRILKDEMLKQLPMIKRKNTSSNSTKNKKHQPNKPWWSDKLSDLWSSVCDAEKLWLRSQSRSDALRNKSTFVRVRKEFDREVQRAKQSHWYSLQEGILNEFKIHP